VPVRRGFDRPPEHMMVHAKPVEQPKPKTVREWPPAVRSYVQRSFAENNTIASVKREDLEDKLKQIIKEAAESDTLFSIDWDNLPLPQQMIVAERNSLYTMPVIQTSDQLANMKMRDTNIPSTPSKKRKSTDGQGLTETIPPWRANQIPLGDRITYADKKPRIDTNGQNNKSPASTEFRRKRFDLNGTSPSSHTPKVEPEIVNTGPVVGRCQTLEKRYLRLTAAPNPDTVRPLHILKQTFELLKQKWRAERNYGYICDQFKSLRQDLTVQHIKTDFTVNVYEIHARIALEKGDLGEYNQCQTQLRALYALNLGGHPVEFKAYRILYFIHTGNRTDMNDVLADLTPTEKNEKPIKHALDTRSALALGNYHRFFKLYLETPHMGAYLMDMFVGRERLAALANICKS
jgi:SAC3 family protein LENG8/THP3